MNKDYKEMRKKSGHEHLISLFYRPLTERITKVLLKTPVTPNQLTTLEILMALLTGFFFALGEWKFLIIGAILAQFSLIFDLLDGQVARYKKLRTMFGSFYDKIANKIMKYLMFLGATIGVYRMTGSTIFLVIGAIAIFNITMISFITHVRHLQGYSRNISELPRSKKYFIPFGMLTVVAISVFALFNILDVYLFLFATLGTLAWIKQLFTQYKIGKDIPKTD
ncbi:hypothetical protein CL617_03520 [archaeon]|nr:hypothetical protein [archaeon]|tara:strand:+ start:547 stop:1215 length:669 start_codon:yes stop_codon:yes gene_type:complete